MTTIHTRRTCGISLIEVMIAMVVMCVASMGVLSYEYHGARQMRVARAKASAVRIGYLLLEEWKANGGSVHYARGTGPYSPENLDMDLVHNKGDKQKRINGVLTNIFEYETIIEGTPMKIELSRPVSYYRLIPLTAVMTWEKQSVVLSTKARIDQAGG